jgi:hypothetical protein
MCKRAITLITVKADINAILTCLNNGRIVGDVAKDKIKDKLLD